MKHPPGSPFYDLHYHPNIHGLPGPMRHTRLAHHARALAHMGHGVVAATEHGYKKPRDGYCWLRDAAAEAAPLVTILPGVECISRQGVDMIFLYASEGDLERATRQRAPFSWDVQDLGRIAAAEGALTIIPHPFFIGRTGAGRILGETGFLRLAEQADYVEVHNGASYPARKALYGRSTRVHLPGERLAGIRYTHLLPPRLRPEGVGWAVGSDAHFPGGQYYLGVSPQWDHALTPFQNLARRRHFTPLPGPDLPSQDMPLDPWSLWRSGRCALGEYLLKSGLQHPLGRRGGAGNCNPACALPREIPPSAPTA
ncbi:MAG: hypothetical protein H7831_01660 [Magnetococcus sp. WYHC-3]